MNWLIKRRSNKVNILIKFVIEALIEETLRCSMALTHIYQILWEFSNGHIRLFAYYSILM